MMLSTILAAGGLALGTLMMQPAIAGPLGLPPAVQSGSGPAAQPVFHEPQFPRYSAPPVYEAPRYVEPRYVEPSYRQPALLPPGRIERLLRQSGYSRVEVVALDGPIYTVQGIDPWDNLVEMKVFGSDGRVLRSDVIDGRMLETPFAERPPASGPPVAIPDGPPIVGAIPQSPPAAESRTEPQIATAPLPRKRPAYRPQPSIPDAEAGAPVELPTDPAPAPDPDEPDPLVVY